MKTAASIVLLCGLAGTAAAAGLSAADRTFLQHDAQGSAYEMQLAKLALQQSTDTRIRQFAQQDIADHGALNRRAGRIASANGMSLPTTIASDKMSKLDQIRALSGASFDRAFVQEMRSLNTEDASEFKDELQSASDAQMKTFVQQGQAIDRKHEAIVDELGAT